MIDENYYGLISQKLDAKTKKAYFKRDQLYIDGNEFISQPNITQETANRDNQQRRQYAVHEKGQTVQIMVAETNTPLVTRDVINEDR